MKFTCVELLSFNDVPFFYPSTTEFRAFCNFVVVSMMVVVTMVGILVAKYHMYKEARGEDPVHCIGELQL